MKFSVSMVQVLFPDMYLVSGRLRNLIDNNEEEIIIVSSSYLMNERIGYGKRIS